MPSAAWSGCQDAILAAGSSSSKMAVGNRGKRLRYVRGDSFEHDVQCRIPDVDKVLGLCADSRLPLDEMLDEVVPGDRRAVAQGLI
jgi:hypothetical protein